MRIHEGDHGQLKADRVLPPEAASQPLFLMSIMSLMVKEELAISEPSG